MKKNARQTVGNFFEAQKILQSKNSSKAIEFAKRNPKYEKDMIEMVLDFAKNRRDCYFLIDVGQNFPNFVKEAEQIILETQSPKDCLKWIENCKVANLADHLTIITTATYKNKREKFFSFLKLLNICEDKKLKIASNYYENECINIAKEESNSILTGPLEKQIFGNKVLLDFVEKHPTKQFSKRIVNEIFMPNICINELAFLLTTNKELVDINLLVENELNLFKQVQNENHMFFDMMFAEQLKDFAVTFKNTLLSEQKSKLSQIALNTNTDPTNFFEIVDALEIKNFNFKKLEEKVIETKNIQLCLQLGCYPKADAQKLGQVVLEKGSFDQNYLFAKNCEKANKKLHLKKMQELRTDPSFDEPDFSVNLGEISRFLQQANHEAQSFYNEPSSSMTELDAKQIILEMRAQKAHAEAKDKLKKFKTEEKQIQEIKSMINEKSL